MYYDKISKLCGQFGKTRNRKHLLKRHECIQNLSSLHIYQPNKTVVGILGCSDGGFKIHDLESAVILESLSLCLLKGCMNLCLC